MSKSYPITRRNLLKGVALGGITSAASFSGIFGYSRVFGQDGDDIQTIINLAATAETFACTHYYAVLTSSQIELSPSEVSILKGFLDAELQHLEFLNSNGAQTLVTEFYAPQNVYNDRVQFAAITEQAEFAFIGAYMAAVRRIAELGNPLLATVAAQVAAVEQEHLALVRQIGGLRPNNQSLARTPFFNTSDAVPVLQPFLEGAENFDGPLPFPGADAIRDIIRDEGVLAIPPATSPDAFKGLSAQDSANITDPNATVVAGSCTVTPRSNFTVNIRSGGSLNSEVVNKLSPGSTLAINGQTTDADSFIWYRSDSGFVRFDVVTTTGDCSVLPTV